MKPARILIIAGSDSGGGAGIQADIKTVTMLGGFAMTAITAITAQDTKSVGAIMAVPADLVLRQIDMVLDDLGADAIKIGMIGAPETAFALAERLERLEGMPIVFDPVMVASSGSELADTATIAAFERLMRVATLVTPNIPELEVLSGRAIHNAGETEEAALALSGRTGSSILAKGGHLAGTELVDILAQDGRVRRWESERIETTDTHGTGCTLASAIASGLGRGLELPQAVELGRDFTRAAILAAPSLGGGHGPMGHFALGSSFGAMNLNQVTVPALDYDASVAFYRALGLTQIVDSQGRYARFECPGGSTLSIHVEPGLEVRRGTIVYFESADLDAWVERLERAGIVFEAPPADQGWRWREARLCDPAGNLLCLYRAGENRRFPPWRLPG